MSDNHNIDIDQNIDVGFSAGILGTEDSDKSNLIISDSDFNFIISRIGYPFVKEEDLEINFNQFKDICILPALQEYYRFFPLVQESVYSVTGSFNIPFPTDGTYGVLDARLSTSRNGTSQTSNPLINSTFIRTSSGFTGGVYGTRYDYELNRVYHLERFTGQSEVAMYSALKINVNHNNRTLEGFSNIYGKMLVKWASLSSDFNDIDFRRKREVQDLASAYILKYLGELRIQGEMSDLPVAFNGATFIDRGEKLEDKTIEKWQSFTKPVIIRK
jgi:hypothetical protein